jgi:hypothetical protein
VVNPFGFTTESKRIQLEAESHPVQLRNSAFHAMSRRH